MGKKTRMFFAMYIAFGLFCLAVVITSRLPDAARHFIRKDIHQFGELYDMCKVTDFKIKLHYVPLPSKEEAPERSVDDARIIFTGDSFFAGSFGRLFDKSTGIPSFDIVFKAAHLTPSDVLRECGFNGSPNARYLVYERVERTLVSMVIYYTKGESPVKDTGVDKSIRKYVMISKPALEYLVTENPVGCWLLERRNTLRFKLFRDIALKTPIYSLNPPMLHYDMSVDTTRLEKPEKKIDELADKISSYGKELRERYGLKMIFVGIPNKYSIYGYDNSRYDYNIKGGCYDNFLPRLYRKLNARGVLCVDLYRDFADSRELLYEPSDDHWNHTGKMIAVNKLAELYRLEESKTLSTVK